MPFITDATRMMSTKSTSPGTVSPRKPLLIVSESPPEVGSSTVKQSLQPKQSKDCTKIWPPAALSHPLNFTFRKDQNQRLSENLSPETHKVNIDNSLKVPQTDTPRRAMTPCADLYDGVASEAFGVSFEHPDEQHWREIEKPTVCTANYEDHKHRMLMGWLDKYI
jgi:hypothetical protein